MGHIYQSHALAEELLQSGAQVQFIVPDVPEGLAKLRAWELDVHEIPHELPDLEKISHIDALLVGRDVDVFIVDILESTSSLMRYMATKATLLVSLDDIGTGRVWADLLINIIHHPPRAAEARYREVNELNYVVLRPEFHREFERVKKNPKIGTKLLVSQGGSDTFGGVVQLVEAMKILPEEVEIHLLVGAAFRHDSPLEKAIAGSGRHFVIERDVEDIAALMQEMDLAITGGGKTLFELAAVGVPFIVVTEEPRELETASIVARHVLCENLGLRSEVGVEKIAETAQRLLADQQKRLAMSQSGKRAVDGRGAWRSGEEIRAALQEKRKRVGGFTL
jgi:UDP-2,4-diacetamido-2,4,6-trideoxy-beta-L-altropyranose hydrolase